MKVPTNKLIFCIASAEFNIDTGSTVDHFYPFVPLGYKKDFFAEYMLPEGSHNREKDTTWIFLNRSKPFVIDNPNYLNVNNDDIGSNDENNDSDFIYCMNIVGTRHHSSYRRGATVKAMALFSKYNILESFRDILSDALDKYLVEPNIEILKTLYEAINSSQTSESYIQFPSYMNYLFYKKQKNLFHTNKKYIENYSFQLKNPFFLQNESNQNDISEYFHIQIPLYRSPDEVIHISITSLLKLVGPQIMIIFHAILMNKRIIFSGYNHSSAVIAHMVLAAVSMVSFPYRRSIMNNPKSNSNNKVLSNHYTSLLHRTFPYATLSDLSFLEVNIYYLIISSKFN